MRAEERYRHGEYSSHEEALTASKAIVDSFLVVQYNTDMSADNLYQAYVCYGDDPFIVPDDPANPEFSAWVYAKQRCSEICVTNCYSAMTKNIRRCLSWMECSASHHTTQQHSDEFKYSAPLITRKRAAVMLALTICVDGVFSPRLSYAADLDLLSIGVRARVDEKRVLGEEQPESFRAFDVVASIRLPWQRYSPSGWGVATRALASAGVLQGADQTALVVSLTPILAFGSEDGRFTLDLGAGIALLSEHRYAQQDFGGPLQFSLTFGVSVPLSQHIGVGYRFMHYSDASAYGSGTIGADFHMLELIHRF